MKFSSVFLFTFQALSSLSIADAANCTPKDIATLKSRIESPTPFCQFYLSKPRTRSPLRELSQAKLEKACRCLIGKTTRTGLSRTSNPKSDSKTCKRSNLKKLKRQYKEPVAFCQWWAAAPRASETRNAVPGLHGVAAVSQACACYNSPVPTTTKASTTSSTASTSTDTISTTADTTSIIASTASLTTSTLSRGTPSATVTPLGRPSVHYVNYFTGKSLTQNLANQGNDQKFYPPIFESLGALTASDAADECATYAWGAPQNYYSFDLHWVVSNSSWECVMFVNQNDQVATFNVGDTDVDEVYGYSLPIDESVSASVGSHASLTTSSTATATAS